MNIDCWISKLDFSFYFLLFLAILNALSCMQMFISILKLFTFNHLIPAIRFGLYLLFSYVVIAHLFELMIEFYLFRIYSQYSKNLIFPWCRAFLICIQYLKSTETSREAIYYSLTREKLSWVSTGQKHSSQFIFLHQNCPYHIRLL